MLSVSVLVHLVCLSPYATSNGNPTNPQYIWLPSLNTSPQKSLNSQVTLRAITRRCVSCPGICSWPSATMRSECDPSDIPAVTNFALTRLQKLLGSVVISQGGVGAFLFSSSFTSLTPPNVQCLTLLPYALRPSAVYSSK